MLRDYELGTEPVHDPRPPRLSLKMPKKILNEATDRNIAIPESEPEHEPEPPLSLKFPKKIWNDGVERNSAIKGVK